MTRVMAGIMIPPVEVVRCLSISLGWIPATVTQLTLQHATIIQNTSAGADVHDLVPFTYTTVEEWVFQDDMVEAMIDSKNQADKRSIFEQGLVYDFEHHILGMPVEPHALILDDNAIAGYKSSAVQKLTSCHCPLNTFSLYIFHTRPPSG
jgi:hypothetical protein